MGDSNYKVRRRFADKFDERLLGIIADLFHVHRHDLRLSTVDEDREDGVDLYIVPLHVAIGLRVRRASAAHYHDLTLREVKNPAGKTEVDKLKLGKINYTLQAIATEDASAENSTADDIDRYVLFDLAPVKAAAENQFAEVLKQYRRGEDFNFVALDIESLTTAYGPVEVAKGSNYIDADGFLVTVTRVHPSFRSAGAGTSANGV